MAMKIISQKNLSWINIDEVNQESLAYLKEHYNFHHLDLEDIESDSQTPKIDTYKNYLFIILQFPHWDTVHQQIVPHEFGVFVGDNYLITIQHTKTKEMKNFFYKCMKNKKTKRDWMNGTSGFLLYNLIEALFHNARPLLNKMGKRIESVEEKIFAEAQDAGLIKELAHHRRNVLTFRRILDPQRYMMANLSHIRKPFLDDTLSLYFDDIGDYLNRLWSMLDTYRDTIEGLHLTVESITNLETNRIVGIFTIITVLLMPLTIFTGAYGMNIALPFDDPNQQYIIWFMLIGLIVITLGLVWWLRKKKLM